MSAWWLLTPFVILAAALIWAKWFAPKDDFPMTGE